MVERTRRTLVGNQGTIIYSTFMIIGLGLLILTLILILKIYEINPTNPQSEIILFVFLLVFAVLGLGLMFIGIIGGLKFLLKLKQPIVREEEIIYDQAAFASQGLQILRPTMPSKDEEPVTRKRDAELKTKIETSLKKDEIIEKTMDKPKAKQVDKAEPISGDFSYNDGLQSIVDRYNTEKVKKAFKDWHNTLMMTFPDISKSFLYKISGSEGIDLFEGTDEEAAVQVKMDSTVFVKMMTKQINPIKAYSSGSLEVKGEMKNMLKLRKLMF